MNAFNIRPSCGNINKLTIEANPAIVAHHQRKKLLKISIRNDKIDFEVFKVFTLLNHYFYYPRINLFNSLEY